MWKGFTHSRDSKILFLHDGRFFIQNSRSYLFQQKLIPTRCKIKAFLPQLFCSTQTVCICVHTPCTVCNVFLILAVTNLKSWLLHCFPNFLLCLNNDFASHCCCLPLLQDASFRKAIFATKVFKEQWPLKSTPRNSTVKEEKTQKSSSEGLQEGFWTQMLGFKNFFCHSHANHFGEKKRIFAGKFFSQKLPTGLVWKVYCGHL